MHKWKSGPFAFIPSMVVSTSAPNIQDFEQPLAYLLFFQKNIFWWIGDLLVSGEAKYGDDLFQYIPLDESISQEMLDRCRAIAIAYPRTERNLNLSWTHHMVAANLDQNIRSAVLRKAETEGWNSGELRTYISKNWKKRSLSSYSKDDSSAGSAD